MEVAQPSETPGAPRCASGLCGILARELVAATGLLDVYRGALAEQFIGQELLARGGSEDHALYYWARPQRNSDAEVDYVWNCRGSIVPVEVKSGAPGRLRSMAIFLDEHPLSTQGLVLSSALPATGQTGTLRHLPLYARLIS